MASDKAETTDNTKRQNMNRDINELISTRALKAIIDLTQKARKDLYDLRDSICNLAEELYDPSVSHLPFELVNATAGTDPHTDAITEVFNKIESEARYQLALTDMTEQFLVELNGCEDRSEGPYMEARRLATHVVNRRFGRK